MPDIALCMDSKDCYKKTCIRHPEQYETHPYQSWMYLKGTECCPKADMEEER